MINHFATHERYALWFILAVIGIGLFLPAIHQPESYHHFADQRSWNAIPNFADVVSNLIFTAAGAIGLYKLRGLPDAMQKVSLPLSVFFGGLLLTGVGSAYYHWAPSAQTILVDRLPMVFAFAGVIGTFLAQRVSARMGLFGLIAGLVVGSAGLAGSAITGNLTLYLALQFGGLAGIATGLFLLKNTDDHLPWWTLIGWYALAKALELGDHLVWELTQHMVSGHTLKHIAAGMAGMVLLRALSGTSNRVACRIAA
ncbi:MAG: hypothetical protein A3I66_18685 [Burkholderiales bacterium RIFCSPLOWO2_02_FULL_57_36]|nr:MAG: hypothetical protein A3I66_18685 [Burkholderiales bacterium RIFCSPLOWO2_02_FULL_57_36]